MVASSETAAPSNATGAFAAAGAGNATLAAGVSLAGFTVTAASVAAVVTGTVTVSNVANGPLTYDFVFTNGGNSPSVLTVTFPQPLAPNGGAIVVAMSATAGGSAGHIVAYGAGGIAEAVVTLFDGAQEVAVIGVPAGPPVTMDLADEGLYVGNQLNITVTGGAVTGAIWVRDTRYDDDWGGECHDRRSNSPPPSQPEQP